MDLLIVALGLVVARCRNAMELSLRAFGARCRVSANSIRHIEGGTYNCRIDILVRIARGCGVPAWRLLRQAELMQGRRKRVGFVD